MTRNLGLEERLARFLLVILIGWYFYMLGNPLYGFIALYFFLEFLFSYSPLNTLLKRTTYILPNPASPWYVRFNWLTWLLGLPIVLLVIYILLLIISFSM